LSVLSAVAFASLLPHIAACCSFACHCRVDIFGNIPKEESKKSYVQKFAGAAASAVTAGFGMLGGSSTSQKEDHESS